MIGQDEFRKIVDHLAIKNCLPSDDGFYFIDTLNEESIQWIEECLSLGLSCVNIVVGDVSIDTATLGNKAFSNKECRVEFSTYELRSMGCVVVR